MCTFMQRTCNKDATYIQRTCKEDYIWNSIIRARECNKKYEIDKCLNNCAFIKDAVDNLVTTCVDEPINNTTSNTYCSKNIYLLFSI